MEDSLLFNIDEEYNESQKAGSFNHYTGVIKLYEDNYYAGTVLHERIHYFQHISTYWGVSKLVYQYNLLYDLCETLEGAYITHFDIKLPYKSAIDRFMEQAKEKKIDSLYTIKTLPKEYDIANNLVRFKDIKAQYSKLLLKIDKNRIESNNDAGFLIVNKDNEKKYPLYFIHLLNVNQNYAFQVNARMITETMAISFELLKFSEHLNNFNSYDKIVNFIKNKLDSSSDEVDTLYKYMPYFTLILYIHTFMPSELTKNEKFMASLSICYQLCDLTLLISNYFNTLSDENDILIYTGNKDISDYFFSIFSSFKTYITNPDNFTPDAPDEFIYDVILKDLKLPNYLKLLEQLEKYIEKNKPKKLDFNSIKPGEFKNIPFDERVKYYTQMRYGHIQDLFLELFEDALTSIQLRKVLKNMSDFFLTSSFADFITSINRKVVTIQVDSNNKIQKFSYDNKNLKNPFRLYEYYYFLNNLFNDSNLHCPYDRTNKNNAILFINDWRNCKINDSNGCSYAYLMKNSRLEDCSNCPHVKKLEDSSSQIIFKYDLE